MDTNTRARHRLQLGLAGETLSSFGVLRLSALGSSMVPTIFPGDVLTIHRANAHDIRCGDVVLCARDDRFIVHRAVRQVQSSAQLNWLTRGDALAKDDPLVSPSQLLGRVTVIERGNRRWAPARASLLARLLQFAIRNSGTLLRVLLSWHSRRRLMASQTLPEAALSLEGGS